MDDSLQSARARLLLVDDTELNRDLIGAILARAGFAVDVAEDGATACELTWSKRYDLVLMDLEMPGMSGFEAAARIRAREGVMSGVTIAALTATAQVDAARFSLWSGIDEFIAKPIDPHRLVARVDEILAERACDGEDWCPVWRLAAFADLTRKLDDEQAAGHLQDFSVLLGVVASAIHTHSTSAASFFRDVRSLRTLAIRQGFDEIAGICALYDDASKLPEGRSRDPNLLGAIDRARYAIRVYLQEKTAPPAGWWAGTRVSVRSLFRGRAAQVADAEYAY